MFAQKSSLRCRNSRTSYLSKVCFGSFALVSSIVFIVLGRAPTNFEKTTFFESRGDEDIIGAPKLQFRVVTATEFVHERLSCGGCTALHQFAEEIATLGYEVKTIPWKRMERTGWDCEVQHDNTVVIFSVG